MGPIAFALCQKPVLGLLMLVAQACAFPPLIQDQAIALDQVSHSAPMRFTAPVGKIYFVDLRVEFSSRQAYADDSVIGTRSDQHCGEDYDTIAPANRVGLGRPLPFRVMVWRAKDKALIADQIFNSLCLASSETRAFAKWRTLGPLRLEPGDYVAEVWNLRAQEGMENVRATLALAAGHGK